MVRIWEAESTATATECGGERAPNATRPASFASPCRRLGESEHNMRLSPVVVHAILLPVVVHAILSPVVVHAILSPVHAVHAVAAVDACGPHA
eukprot:5844174-Pyramimonas_sp.AAC.1